MKAYKRAGILCCVLLTAAMSYLLYESHFSKRAIIGNRNEANASTVTIGMGVNTVIQIMGPPTTITEAFTYVYIANNGDNVNIQITFDSNARVSRISGLIKD